METFNTLPSEMIENIIPYLDGNGYKSFISANKKLNEHNTDENIRKFRNKDMVELEDKFDDFTSLEQILMYEAILLAKENAHIALGFDKQAIESFKETPSTRDISFAYTHYYITEALIPPIDFMNDINRDKRLLAKIYERFEDEMSVILIKLTYEFLVYNIPRDLKYTVTVWKDMLTHMKEIKEIIRKLLINEISDLYDDKINYKFDLVCSFEGDDDYEEIKEEIDDLDERIKSLKTVLNIIE